MSSKESNMFVPASQIFSEDIVHELYQHFYDRSPEGTWGSVWERKEVVEIDLPTIVVWDEGDQSIMQINARMTESGTNDPPSEEFFEAVLLYFKNGRYLYHARACMNV